LAKAESITVSYPVTVERNLSPLVYTFDLELATEFTRARFSC